MWNLIRKIAKKHSASERDKLGMRLAVFAIAVAIYEGLSMVSTSIDGLAKNIENLNVDSERVPQAIFDLTGTVHALDINHP